MIEKGNVIFFAEVRGIREKNEFVERYETINVTEEIFQNIYGIRKRLSVAEK